MSLDPAAIRIANQRLWAAHPELGGRALGTDAADAPLRAEWQRYYTEAANKKPPPPAAVPAAVVPPPAAKPVAACGAAKPRMTSDCKDIRNHVQEGDVILRGERGDSESEFIAKVSGCEFSHAGIVARNAKGELVAVDAYPGRKGGAVAESPIDDFFCGHGATDGLVARPSDPATAKKAAAWAQAQTSKPDYVFDLWDPWNNDPKRLYCADFVYQSYQNAGLDLAPVKTDLLDATHRATTIAEARKMSDNPLAGVAPDAKIEEILRKKTGGSSEYITPCQVAQNANTCPVLRYKSAPVPASGTGGKKKG
jgi:hypothetical protein